MTLHELKPVKRRSTVEHIADELRQEIMSGSLEPGAAVDSAQPRDCEEEIVSELLAQKNNEDDDDDDDDEDNDQACDGG